MDALLALLVLTVVLVLVGLSAAFGVDSRDGFADDRYRQAYR